ncbi:hypothetical protein ACWCPD_25000 [Streptomyces sp. NPDC001935]
MIAKESRHATFETRQSQHCVHRRVKRPRISLLVALGIGAVSVAGCGSSDDEGLPVRVVNESAWDAHVFGCPQCGRLGLVVVGDPDRKPGEGGGAYFGWTEGRAWPVTYKVVFRGVESVCPFIDPEPGKAEGAVGTRDVIYVVDESGKCGVGPASMDEI